MPQGAKIFLLPAAVFLYLFGDAIYMYSDMWEAAADIALKSGAEISFQERKILGLRCRQKSGKG